MIIFYRKETGEIFGVVEGRQHDEDSLENAMIRPVGVMPDDIGKYLVPYKTVYEEVEQPVTELRMVDEETKRVEEVQVGTEKVKRGVGMKPDGPFADLVEDFDLGRKNIYDYRVDLKNNKVVGFEKKKDNK